MNDKDLEKAIDIIVLCFNLKSGVRRLGFELGNGKLFVKKDEYETYIKFESDHMALWSSYNSNRKIVKRYEDVYDVVNNELYTSDSYLHHLIALLEY